MNKAKLFALCLLGLVANSPGAFAADSVDSTVPGPDSTGPTNPTPPTLPTPGTGIDKGTGTGIDGHDSAPTPGTDGTGREEIKGDTQSPGAKSPSSQGSQPNSANPGS
jgi:hypothetical protein